MNIEKKKKCNKIFEYFFSKKQNLTSLVGPKVEDGQFPGCLVDVYLSVLSDNGLALLVHPGILGGGEAFGAAREGNGVLFHALNVLGGGEKFGKS